jgi:hypothetical protein
MGRSAAWLNCSRLAGREPAKNYKTSGNKAHLKRAYENPQVTNSPMTATRIVLAKKDRYEKTLVIPVDPYYRFYN